jgi:hypothetical protein
MKIIDNKKIDLTEDEYETYLRISAEYKQGKDLFRDLFETNEDGLIIFIKPPKRIFSMEIVVFLQNIMVHQHLRKIYAEHEQAMKELKELINQVKSNV